MKPKNNTGDWYQVDLSLREVREDAALFELQHDAWQFFNSSGEPARMAIFPRDHYDGNKLPVFFSPGSVRPCEMLLKRFAGAPCAKPTGRLRLLVGKDGAETLLR